MFLNTKMNIKPCKYLLKAYCGMENFNFIKNELYFYTALNIFVFPSAFGV